MVIVFFAVLFFLSLAACSPSPDSGSEIETAGAIRVQGLVREGNSAPEEVTREDTVAVAAWDVHLIQRHRCRPSSDVCATELFVLESGVPVRLLSSNLQGPFVLFLDDQRILSCESNAVLNTEGPVMIDLRGGSDTLPPHPGYLRECAAVGDGNEAILVYNVGSLEALSNIVRVFSSSGTLLVERRLETAATIDITGSQSTYTVAVNAPELPG